jgi:hypothetical protein
MTTPEDLAQDKALKPVSGEMFTTRCRRLLNEQPSQREFTISRAGLEVLVTDSERYGDQNAKLAAQFAAHKKAYPDPDPLENQMQKVLRNWPGSILHDPRGNGTVGRWLEVPVSLPKAYRKGTAHMFILLPDGYPFSGPHRFYLPYSDASLDHGGLPKCVSGPQKIDGRELCELFWKIARWDGRHMDLFTYVKAMERGLIACAEPYDERDQ